MKTYNLLNIGDIYNYSLNETLANSYAQKMKNKVVYI